jgi:hypothetical protein
MNPDMIAYANMLNNINITHALYSVKTFNLTNWIETIKTIDMDNLTNIDNFDKTHMYIIGVAIGIIVGLYIFRKCIFMLNIITRCAILYFATQYIKEIHNTKAITQGRFTTNENAIIYIYLMYIFREIWMLFKYIGLMGGFQFFNRTDM